MYVPNGKELEEITGDKLNLKELYKNFRGTKSHALVSIPFLCNFNLFLGSKVKTTKEEISKLFSNLPFKALSKNDESPVLRFDALTDLFIEINVRLNNAIFADKSRQKK